MARSSSPTLGAPSVIAGLAALALAIPGATGCSRECCSVDSEPIPVSRAPLGQGLAPGALLARAQPPGGGAPFSMVVDTASPVTILAAPPATGALEISQSGFDLLDGTEPAPNPPRVRARFRDLGLFALPLGAVGSPATVPGGVIGGDLLHAFSVELRFAAACLGVDAGAAAGGCSFVTFWPHQGASLAFLQDAGYAVLRFTLFGGGETTATSRPDFLGLQGPVTLSPSRIVLRTCAAPRVFSRTEPREACCARGDEIVRASGADLSLLLATGVGPMVLSKSAWTRVSALLPQPPAMTSAPLLVATWPTPTSIAATWTTMPRYALVDGFDPPSTGDEGPCVDLGRARRIEWTEAQIAATGQAQPAVGACVQPCDTDPSESAVALNSAAYIELGGEIPVAVVDDAEPFLQALRFDIRPKGPDIDGLLGAAALGAARLEIDYVNDAPRAIFSCEPTATRDACYASARCPRLPDHDHRHLCFGLPAPTGGSPGFGLPGSCAPSGC
jgi:hypothetical protein